MKIKIAILSLMLSSHALAGVDLSSTIERIKLNGDGKLWLKMTSASFEQYRKPGWYGFNLFIPESDKISYITMDLLPQHILNSQSLYIANISKFDGAQTCDITQTGYGIVVKKTL